MRVKRTPNMVIESTFISPRKMAVVVRELVFDGVPFSLSRHVNNEDEYLLEYQYEHRDRVRRCISRMYEEMYDW